MNLVEIPEQDMEFIAEAYTQEKSPQSYFDFIEGMKAAVKYLNAVKFSSTVLAEYDSNVNAIIVNK